MSILLDYLPLILFFGTFKIYGLYVPELDAVIMATEVAIAASTLQLIYLYYRKKIAIIHWLQFGILAFFGGLTILLKDPIYIQWKPTVIYLTFAAILLGSKIIWRKDLLRHVMKTLTLPDNVWGKLTWSWGLFFIVLAILNRYVAMNYSMNAWINFKVWGSLILILVFAVIQGIFLARYLKE